MKRIAALCCLVPSILLADLPASAGSAVRAAGSEIPPSDFPEPLRAPLLGAGRTEEGTDSRARTHFGNLPVSFEPNQGQTHPSVRFLTRGSGYTLYLTADGAVFALSEVQPDAPAPRAARTALGRQYRERKSTRPASPSPAPSGGWAVRMRLIGAARSAPVSGEGVLPGVVSYFRGSNPRKWVRGVSTYARVRYQGIYPGIDLVFRERRDGLHYDFVVAPQADPAAISLRFDGAEMQVDRGGNLVLTTPLGDLVHEAPRIYQQIDGERRRVSGRYRMEGESVGFAVGGYDHGVPLIIDPPVKVAYSTFLGGAGYEGGFDIAVDSAGAAYVTGATHSIHFPTTLGAFDTTGDVPDAFVTKLDPWGSALSYSTFLGGTGTDFGAAIAVDSAGAAYLSGPTASIDFPTTPGAFDTAHNGDLDAFVTKLDPSGSALSYSTFLGGTGTDVGAAIAVDSAGAAYVAGSTASIDFPTTPGAFDNVHGFGVLASRFDAFVAKLDPSGGALSYSTFIGAGGSDFGHAIAVDSAGAAYVAGRAGSTEFPTTSGAFDTTHNGDFDAFVTKLDPSGSALSYSTFLGGTGNDSGAATAVDSAGAAYIAGTPGTDFPTTPGAFDTSPDGRFTDLFVTKLDPSGGALSYSTFLGGTGTDRGSGIALDSAGAAYVTGDTASTDFPTTPGAFDTTHNGGDFDAFVTKLERPGMRP